VLARAGVREADLGDATQEVFMVVSQKLEQREAGTKVTTWLYGIAIRVGANHRRKVQRKREDFTEHALDAATDDAQHDPEQVALRAEGRVQLARALEELTPDQRIVFEMFELEEMTCPAIAETLGIPLGTAYTRLRAARAAFAARAERLAAGGDA
jgi:RNA polymerase sigma-70 factor (ECF subfamily)